jgi:hypothetical protein
MQYVLLGEQVGEIGGIQDDRTVNSGSLAVTLISYQSADVGRWVEGAQIALRLRYDDDARRRALAVGASLQRAERTSKVPLVPADHDTRQF